MTSPAPPSPATWAAVECSPGASMRIGVQDRGLRIEFGIKGIETLGCRTFFAVEGRNGDGSSILPFAKDQEGSTVFLPFPAGTLYMMWNEPGRIRAMMRRWLGTEWGPWEDAGKFVTAQFSSSLFTGTFRIDGADFTNGTGVIAYAKNMTQNDGWGRMLGVSNIRFRGAALGLGDQYLAEYLKVTISADARTNTAAISVAYETRMQRPSRVRIYQLFVRLFGNVNETRKVNGTLAENGSGKFSSINDAAIASIAALGCTHIWLTGILRQATSTDYSSLGLPADDPDLLKGLAGSPYAIRDYFDVCPDYADNPRDRLEEFKALIARIHAQGLKVIIDLVPNHVARSYRSTVRPDLSFGEKDDPTKFFDGANNFFYLHPTASPGGGPPLKLPTFSNGVAVSPTCKVLKAGDGLFDPEKTQGRVTGNNAITWSPSLNDWYETVKLNYGIDFTNPSARVFPTAAAPDAAIPDTWLKFDEILSYWQQLGVDGFRCDMAHMIPPEFWRWAIRRARARQPDVWFMGEAYNDDPAKLPGTDPVTESIGNVMASLLNAGFDSVYDDPSYKTLKSIYERGCWANDMDALRPPDFVYENSLRYAENHDEVRLAGRGQWGSVGMNVGRPVAAILYGIGRGALMLYNGQEVGEPASGVQGFSGDNARSTIFDYWSMPELVKWVNGHAFDGGRLSQQQKDLRAFYARLINLVGEPAFAFGGTWRLNYANASSASFGRVNGDPASGHWMYAFLRYDIRSRQRWLVVANLHPTQPFTNVQLRIPPEAIAWLNILTWGRATLKDRLSDSPLLTPRIPDLPTKGLTLPKMPPLSAAYYEITRGARLAG